jgi:hypothetical protein
MTVRKISTGSVNDAVHEANPQFEFWHFWLHLLEGGGRVLIQRLGGEQQASSSPEISPPHVAVGSPTSAAAQHWSSWATDLELEIQSQNFIAKVTTLEAPSQGSQTQILEVTGVSHSP